MPQPSTFREVIDLIRRSNAVEPDRLATYFNSIKEQKLPGLTPQGLLRRMVGDRVLTAFQAERLRNGKWKGFILGNYRLLEKLATGGMGKVFVAEHTKLGRRVAIKVLDPKLCQNTTARMRFVREAQAAAKLAHENIVQVFDVNTDVHPPYIVMELINGLSLQAAVALAGPFDPGSAAVCGQQMAIGLQHAFKNGLVHRDIKPANAVIDRNGKVKLLDLGIARIDDGKELTQSTNGEKLILGTIEYLAPEQAIDSTRVDTRADIYSLGATLYFLLTGAPPFAKAIASAKLMLKQTELPPPVHTLREDVSKEFSDVIQTMLACRPEDRYSEPFEVVHALTPFAVPPADFPNVLFKNPSTAGDETGQFISISALSGQSNTPFDSKADMDFGAAYDDLQPTDRIDPDHLIVADNDDNLGSIGEFDSPETPIATVGTISDRTADTPGPKSRPVKTEPPVTSTTRQALSPKDLRKTKWLAFGLGAGVASIGLLGFAIYLLIASNGSSNKVPAKSSMRVVPKPVQEVEIPDSSPTVLIVSKSGKPSHHSSLASALRAVSLPQSRIEIWDDAIVESLSIDDKTPLPANLTIVGMAPSGERTIWRAPLPASPKSWMHRIVCKTGIRFEHIVFDGDNRHGYLMQAAGANVEFVDNIFRNYSAVGLEIVQSNRNTIDGCQFLTQSNSSTSLHFVGPCQRTAVRGCWLEGKSSNQGTGIQFSSSVDTADIVGNRFRNWYMGVRFASHSAATQVALRQNVFSNCEWGVNVLKANVNSTYRFTGNVFDAGGWAVHVHSQVPFLTPFQVTSDKNVFTGKTREGNVALKAEIITGPSLPMTADENSRLRWRVGQLPAKYEGKVGLILGEAIPPIEWPASKS